MPCHMGEGKSDRLRGVDPHPRGFCPWPRAQLIEGSIRLQSGWRGFELPTGMRAQRHSGALFRCPGAGAVEGHLPAVVRTGPSQALDR